jgi:omega-hydroxy-beta-dihydromenaquinone-9 sulfotransferase
MSGDLALSRPLLAWLRTDPAWPTLPGALRARLVWQATWGSVNARLGGATANGAAALDDPLLVLGPWRSGTTVMHELLVAATGCAAPLTWQCMNACAFELGAPPRRGLALARPMDGLEVRANSPQEDEFALLTLGVASSYRAFWMPHRLSELGATLDASYWLDDAAWWPVWHSFLLGVLRRAGPGAAQPLILKSPNHTWRMAAIRRRHPGAREVWMLRDPVQVFHSNRKMWSAMFAAHALSAPRDGELDDFLCRALHGAAAALRETIDGAADPSRVCFVPHDALLTRPAAVIDSLIERLRLPRAADSRGLRDALQRVARGRIERHDAALPLLARSACEALAEQQARAAAHACAPG